MNNEIDSACHVAASVLGEAKVSFITQYQLRMTWHF